MSEITKLMSVAEIVKQCPTARCATFSSSALPR